MEAAASSPSHLDMQPPLPPSNCQAGQTLTCKVFFLIFGLTCGFRRLALFLNTVIVTEDDKELRSPSQVGGNSFCGLKNKRTGSGLKSF